MTSAGEYAAAGVDLAGAEAAKARRQSAGRKALSTAVEAAKNT